MRWVGRTRSMPSCSRPMPACKSSGGSRGKSGVLQTARRCHSAADLPDVSKCFEGIAQGIDHPGTLHGVVFEILVGGGPGEIIAPAPYDARVQLDRPRMMRCIIG